MTMLKLKINGKDFGPIDVPDDMMLVDVLHEYLGLTGTRFGCGQGECRACTVIVDDARGPREVRSCITGAHYFSAKPIRTVEGHATRDTAGKIVNATTVLLERLAKSPVLKEDVEATILEALNPHLCRCTGYVRYYQAVKQLVLSTPGLVKP